MGKSNVVKRAYRYVRYDIREILFPSSIPNPPGYVPPEPTSLRERAEIITSAFRLYIDSWNSKKLEAQLRQQRGEPEDVPGTPEREEDAEDLKQLAAELKDTAKGGAHVLWPHLQHLYKTRAKAYREAVKQFIEGYKEGFQESNKPDVPPEVAEEMAAAASSEPLPTSPPEEVTSPPKQPHPEPELEPKPQPKRRKRSKKAPPE